MVSFSVTYSLAHVEGEAEFLFLGEEQDEKVITRLTLLDGRIQTDLTETMTDEEKEFEKDREHQRQKNARLGCETKRKV